MNVTRGRRSTEKRKEYITVKALVLGGTGFLGANITRHLVDAGHEARIMMRRTSSTTAVYDLEYEAVFGDILDAESLAEAMAGIDWVFNTAALITMRRSEWDMAYSVNVEGTRHAVHAALKTGVKKFVHTSTYAALGRPAAGETGDETTEWNQPVEHYPYNNTKRLSEFEVRSAVEKGLDAVILNPGNVMGERDINFSAGRLLADVYNGRMPFSPPGGGSWCDADEVARAHITAAQKGRTGERYVLAGENVSYARALRVMADVCGKRPPAFTMPAALISFFGRLGDFYDLTFNKEPLVTSNSAYMAVSNYYFSSEKARRELNYRTVPYRDSIEKSYRWYVDHGILKP